MKKQTLMAHKYPITLPKCMECMECLPIFTIKPEANFAHVG